MDERESIKRGHDIYDEFEEYSEYVGEMSDEESLQLFLTMLLESKDN